ncbi:MAG: hypothetical protein GY859_29710 [Desulfobacterales bacterium]|nr:hypothetical protein [Desulfobacterales bacterium]
MEPMDRCPTCRAKYKGKRRCYRCKTDLGPLLDVEERAAAHYEAARAAHESGDLETMFLHAGRSFSLRRAPESRRLLAAAALLTRRRALALALWRQAPAAPGSEIAP